MLIYKKIIENYINTTLNPNIIIDYACKNGYNLSNSESIIIYNYIKRNYKSILNKDESSFQELKKELNPNLYNKIYEIYMNYKSKLF